MDFHLPDIGEGVTEGEIVEWLVAPGDSVSEDDGLVEVMTDKATVTIPAPVSGRVSALAVAPGDTVAVGAVIAVFDGAGSPAPTITVAAPQPVQTSAQPAASAAPGGQIEFRLPDIGEGVTEGEIVEWLVAPGATVSEDDGLVEVMTDKATVTIPSPVSGVLGEQLAAAGATVQVGAVIAVFGAGALSGPAVTPPAVLRAAPGGRVLATPATRKRARELAVDIRLVPGTGAHGRITREDVERAAAAPTARPQAAAPIAAPKAGAAPKPMPAPARAASPASPLASAAEDQRIPIRGIRRKIAEAMTRSKSTAAHFTYVEEVNVTRLVEARSRAKPVAAERGVRLTYLAYITKAVVATLRQFPRFNSNMDDAANELIVRGDLNIGIAVDTKNGLVVPVIKQAGRRSLLGLAQEIQRIGGAARDGKLARDDLTGGSFTITSAGSIGGLLATPIINYPEVAILGIHKIQKRPIVDDSGAIVVADIMYLSISLDHRIIDGANAARFMNVLVKYIEQPDLLLLD